MTPKPLFQNLEYVRIDDFQNFDLLFEKYGACLYGLILNAVEGDAFVAETLTGQAFAKIYQYKNVYDPTRQRILTWMLTLVVQVIKENGYNNQLFSTCQKKICVHTLISYG